LAVFGFAQGANSFYVGAGSGVGAVRCDARMSMRAHRANRVSTSGGHCASVTLRFGARTSICEEHDVLGLTG